MKHIFFLIALSLTFIQCAKKTTMPAASTSSVDKAWRSKAPAPAPARDIQIGTYNTFDLDNGLKVIVVENHKLPRVSYQLSFNNDALIEGDKAGYSSFAGDLISKGTTIRTKAQIDEEIDYIGASLSTSSSGIFASSLKKHTPKLLDVMTDVLFNPTYPQSEFEKLRKRTASNLASSKTNPEAIASNIRSVVNFGANHPYGEVQTDETIKNITVDDCKKYVDTYFRPNNAYLVIVGDITPEEAKAEVTKYFSSWKKGQIPTFKYPLPISPKGAQVRFGNKDGAVQSVINISYPVDMKPGNADAIKSSLMNSILGGGIFSGRLMQNLREKRAYTYGARSSISTDKLIGNFNAFASVRNEVTDSAVTEFIYELNRIVNEPVDEKDLSLAKSSLNGGFARSLESPQTVANFALNTFRYNLPLDYYQNYLKNLDAVTVNDVQMMAQKYIRPENCNIVVVGNKDNVADKLKKFDADGKLDFYDSFGKKIKDAKIEIPEGVTGEQVINDYIAALGGSQKLKAIKTVSTTMSSSIMGQEATIQSYKKTPNMYAQAITFSGMTVQEQKTDGMIGMRAQMGNKQMMEPGEELEDLKSEATPFEQLEYNNGKYTLTLIGIENVDGVNCYKLSVKEPNGKDHTEYYDIKTNLLIKLVAVEQGPQGPITVSTDFKNYKEVAGIMVPHTLVVAGAMPAPMEMNISAMEFNGVIPADAFKVE